MMMQNGSLQRIGRSPRWPVHLNLILHQCAKFRTDQSYRCTNITIFRDRFVNVKIHWSVMLNMA